MEQIELEEFLKEAVGQVECGIDIEQRNIEGVIQFEVSISKTIKIAGGLKFYVFSGKHDRDQEQVAKMSFKVYPRESEKSKRQIEEIRRQNEEEAEKWRGWSG